MCNFHYKKGQWNTPLRVCFVNHMQWWKSRLIYTNFKNQKFSIVPQIQMQQVFARKVPEWRFLVKKTTQSSRFWYNIHRNDINPLKNSSLQTTPSSFFDFLAVWGLEHRLIHFPLSVLQYLVYFHCPRYKGK